MLFETFDSGTLYVARVGGNRVPTTVFFRQIEANHIGMVFSLPGSC